MFNVCFQWTRTLRFLLLFTVHRTWISWLSLLHTDCSSSVFPPLSSQPRALFCRLQRLYFNVLSHLVVLASPSLCLCYMCTVKLTYFRTGEGSDSVFRGRDPGFLGSEFLSEGWDANVSTLYNDGQLCIYCLFIVDLYIKRNEYIIYTVYIYISIHNEILWPCFWSWYRKTMLSMGLVHSRLFLRCFWKRRWLHVGKRFTGCLFCVNAEDEFWALLSPSVLSHTLALHSAVRVFVHIFTPFCTF